MASNIEPTTPRDLDIAVSQAARAADEWAVTPAATRKAALEKVADALDAAADELVQLAHEETHIPVSRLRSELKRTTFQLRLFGEVLEEGAYLDVRIDEADPDWPMGAPRPDLRRMLTPMGPAVVFAASNFPFAFSVAGGDTAAALAAGCPVVLKAHSGHPKLSARTGELVVGALKAGGAPEGTFAVVFGTEAGRAVLTDPRIKVGAFTGSIAGGRALLDLANARPEPIPFYAEMSSVNPVFVTKSAAADRGDDIVTAFIGSMTTSAGQLCTKPGILFVPEQSSMVAALRQAQKPDGTPLLNGRIHEGYVNAVQSLQERPEVQTITFESQAYGEEPSPTILLTKSTSLRADPENLLTECFGPAALVVTYEDESELVEVAQLFHGQLTASIQGEAQDAVVPALLQTLAKKAGRLLWNDWPTGVSVTYAQQHGGPYPATSASHTTSVGTAAIVRFVRPVAYQGFPQELLPEQLRKGARTPQRVSTPGSD